MKGEQMTHTPGQRIIAQFIDECGCSATGTDDKSRLAFNRCPLHAATPSLLAALEGLMRFDVFIDTLAAGRADSAKEALAVARAAIKEAKK